MSPHCWWTPGPRVGLRVKIGDVIYTAGSPGKRSGDFSHKKSLTRLGRL